MQMELGEDAAQGDHLDTDRQRRHEGRAGAGRPGATAPCQQVNTSRWKGLGRYLLGDKRSSLRHYVFRNAAQTAFLPTWVRPKASADAVPRIPAEAGLISWIEYQVFPLDGIGLRS